MVTMQFAIKPDEHGIVDGCALARQMIVSAFELVAAYTDGNDQLADRMFNGVLLASLNEIADRKAAAAKTNNAASVKIIAPDLSADQIPAAFARHKAHHDREEEYVASWYSKFLSVSERGQREGFAVAREMNRRPHVIDFRNRESGDS